MQQRSNLLVSQDDGESEIPQMKKPAEAGFLVEPRLISRWLHRVATQARGEILQHFDAARLRLSDPVLQVL
jgi:hypothetical protein